MYLLFALRFETDGHGLIQLVIQVDPTDEPEVWAEYQATDLTDDMEIVRWCNEAGRAFLEEQVEIYDETS